MNRLAGAAVTVRLLTDFRTVEILYKTRMKKDFPPDELKPLSAIRRLWQDNAYDCCVLSDGEKILGYAFFVRRDRNYLLDYLAVSEECRGEGVGTLFLKLLSECLGDAEYVVAEIEDPDKAEDEETRMLRERRMQFYVRSGFHITKLVSRIYGVDYRVVEMPVNTVHTTEEIRTVYTELYGNMLPKAFYSAYFRVFNDES